MAPRKNSIYPASAADRAVSSGVAGAVIGSLVNVGKMSCYCEIVTRDRQVAYRINSERKNIFVKWAEGAGLIK